MNLLLNGPKGSFVIVDYVILVLAVISNCVVLQGIIKAKFNLAGYRRFLISLVISELYVCAVNLALFMFEILTWYMPNSFGNHCESHVLRSFQLVGFFANLLNLLGMTMDHFIGIVYPLKYRSWMSTSMARTAVCIIWVTSVIFGFADMPVATVKYLSQKTIASSTKPAVCSGNVIADIVSILESSDFLTANSQLLFNNNEANRLKQAANAAAIYKGRNKNGTTFGAVGNGTDYSGGSDGNNYYNLAVMSDPVMYPFLLLEPNDNYNYDTDKIRDTRSANSKGRKNRTVKPPQSAPLISNNTLHRAITGASVTAPTTSVTATDFRRLPSTSPLYPLSLLLQGSNFTFPPSFTTGAMDPLATVTMTTLFRKIVQSPENEVALCEALIKAQNKMDDHGWCSQYGSDPWLEVCIMSLTAFCFIFFTFCYGKIFRLVFVEAEFRRRKTRKMVVTTCLLLSIFAICYLPFMLYEFFMMWYDDAAQVQSSTTTTTSYIQDDDLLSYDMFLLIHNVFNSLLLSYPLFDPIIFVARSPPVMRNVVEQFSCLLPCCPSVIQERIQQIATNKYSTNSEISRNALGRNSYRLSTRRHSEGASYGEDSCSKSSKRNGKANESGFSRRKRDLLKNINNKSAVGNNGSNNALLPPPSASSCCLTEVNGLTVTVNNGNVITATTNSQASPASSHLIESSICTVLLS